MREKAHLADADELFRDDAVERLADAVVLLDEVVDEVGFVRHALEEEEGVDGVGVRVGEGREEVRLLQGDRQLRARRPEDASQKRAARTLTIDRCSAACCASSLRNSRSIALTCDLRTVDWSLRLRLSMACDWLVSDCDSLA